MTVYTPLKAMRLKCLDCCCNNAAEVRRCPCEDCTLWPYRFGHRPKTVGYAAETDDDDEGNIDTPPEGEA